MTEVSAPQEWKRPEWHPDLFDHPTEFEELRSLASAILQGIPRASVALQTPEPGLMSLKVTLPTGLRSDVYSVLTPGYKDKLRYALYLSPETDDESENYFESIDEVCAFLARAENS